MMKKELTLKDIAGYATDKMVWQMMLDLSVSSDSYGNSNIAPQRITVADNHFQLKNTDTSDHGGCRAFSAPELFAKKFSPSAASSVWTIGALAFYAITGTDVFDGKGGETQTKDTEIPRLSSAHASRELSKLINRCLSYMPAERPTKEEIQELAHTALAQPAVPRKRLSGRKGKSYASSLIRFWPEEMVPAIIFFLFIFLPTSVYSQTSRFGKTSIPGEMVSLVLRSIDLRSPKNVVKVSKAMDRDMLWTMMDELPVDKNGECTTKTPVDMFGLNDMGFGILKRNGGVTNAGGRFRDGRDPRYKYSFIEITVKQGKEVNYTIGGREGKQMFAVVPFEKSANYEVYIPHGESFSDDGVCYIQLKQGLKKNDTFKLTLKNKSGRNMAFVIINYNSRNNE